eukprot:2828304-Pleurochrysis_carterae.AAC.1
MPYLMDLTLYLGRQLRTTPALQVSSEEDLLSAAERENGVVELGKFPTTLLTTEVQRRPPGHVPPTRKALLAGPLHEALAFASCSLSSLLSPVNVLIVSATLLYALAFAFPLIRTLSARSIIDPCCSFAPSKRLLKAAFCVSPG